MNGVMEIRDHLLDELNLAVRTSENLIKRINEEEWAYQPQDNMRTLQELVYHLVTIPVTDLVILQEKSQEEVQRKEAEVERLSDPEDLAAEFRKNYETFRDYMLALSEEDLLHKSSKAFYMDHGAVQIKWLIEVVTHTFHHRSQLYNYLKQQGHDLNFFMLYG